jgi:hypothetical protein
MMNMNCTHANDKSDYHCVECAMTWLWSVVLFSRTCLKAVLRFQYVIEEETVGSDIEIGIVEYRKKKYVYKGVFNDDYEVMMLSMSDARVAFKVAVATFLGITNFGLAAFIDENEATHGTTDRGDIRRDLGMQEASVHHQDFKYCGDHVNSLQEIADNIKEVMKGITIPHYPGKYVCIEELQIVMGNSKTSCAVLINTCKDELLYPNDFNPGDPRSVREAVEFAMSF